MRSRNFVLLCFCVLATACGGGFAEPKEAQIQSEAAVRGAMEVGADKDPQATLHLKYAKDEIDEAKKLIAQDDNERASFVLMRARADAELSLMLAKAHNEQVDAQKAQDEDTEMRKKLGK